MGPQCPEWKVLEVGDATLLGLTRLTRSTMNSYPPELLVQLAPVMFVAGLDVPAVPETIPSAAPGSPPSMRLPQDPFVSLTVRLRDALLSQRTAVVWQPEKSKTFQTVLVDKVRSVLQEIRLVSKRNSRISASPLAKSHYPPIHTDPCTLPSLR